MPVTLDRDHFPAPLTLFTHTVDFGRSCFGRFAVCAAGQARRRQREETMGSDPERTFSGPEREYIKETYDVMLGTFKDYAEMIIQVYC